MSAKLWVGDDCTHATYLLVGSKLTQISDYGCVGDPLHGKSINESMSDSAIARVMRAAWLAGCDSDCRMDPEYAATLRLSVERLQSHRD